ncbi:mechanosensitive ion channel family protein [Allomuricauda sp. d1]|uniref:mechanosensitive ion channel family protein n=1 Tax=Allomuricauda sp. d1 TaxID=3136725 RepID=UPI0031CE208B
MREFIFEHQNELLATIISLVAFLILRQLFVAAIKKVGRISDLNMSRTRLVSKYVTFGLFALLLVFWVLVWGIDIKEIGLIVSSVFAVLGVALFATWSIASNITAGIILFFYFPYKIGDRIRILDKDFPEEALILDIKAFHINLMRDNGELLTYPNNLLLQKGVVLVQKEVATEEDLDHTF